MNLSNYYISYYGFKSPELSIPFERKEGEPSCRTQPEMVMVAAVVILVIRSHLTS